MSLPLEAADHGKKRACPIEREMEKCAACRRKKIKCLPIGRDWSKGEKCYNCATKNEPCGPNVRADRSARLRIIPPTLSDERPSVPSAGRSLLGPSSTITTDGSKSHHAEPDRSSLDGSFGRAASDSRGMYTGARDDSSTEQKTPIASSFLQLGDLRITLKNALKRLEAINSSTLRNHHTSHTSKSETALDVLAMSLHNEHTNVLKHILLLIEDINPGPSLELALRRTLDAMEAYVEVAATLLGSDETFESRMIEWRSAVLEKLFDIYETQGDFSEAEYFAQKLDLLRETFDSSDSETTKRLAYSLDRTSRRMRHVVNKVPILSKYRGSLHLTNDADPFPSIHRAMLDRNQKVVRFLCDTTKDVLEKQEDILRRGVLHLAAETANEEILDHLNPQMKAFLGKRDKCLKTPLCVAAQHGDYDFFVKLAKFSSDSDLRTIDEQGRSVLTLACGAGHFRIVEFLLQNNISPNEDALQYCSPLYAAASSGHADICRSLLEHGAWVDWYTQDKTASEIAIENGYNYIVAMIEEYRSRPQNLWETHQGQPSSFTPAPETVHTTLDPPKTPKRPLLGMYSPPPSYHRSHQSCEPAALRTNLESKFDPSDHLG